MHSKAKLVLHPRHVPGSLSRSRGRRENGERMVRELYVLGRFLAAVWVVSLLASVHHAITTDDDVFFSTSTKHPPSTAGRIALTSRGVRDIALAKIFYTIIVRPHPATTTGWVVVERPVATGAL